MKDTVIEVDEMQELVLKTNFPSIRLGSMSKNGFRRVFLSPEIKDQATKILYNTKFVETEGWGDKVEKALALVGITEKRIMSLIRRSCGCQERKELLNRLGIWANQVLGLTKDE